MYFFGTQDGAEWSGKNYWGVTEISGTAQLLAGAVSASLFFDVNLTLYNYMWGDIQNVYVTVGSNTYRLYTDGGNCLLGAGHVSQIWDIPSTILQEIMNNGGQVVLTIDICLGGYILPPNDEVTITAYVQESFTSISQTANLTVGVSAGGKVLAGVPITVDDTNTGESYQLDSDQNGIAVFTNLPAYDSVTVTVSYQTFQTLTKGLTLQAGDNSISLQLQCADGYTFCGGGCVQACPYGTILNPQTCQCVVPLVNSIDQLLISAGVAGAILLGGYAVTKIIPSRKIEEKENVNKNWQNPELPQPQQSSQKGVLSKGWESVKSYASSAYNRIRGKTNEGGNQ